MDQLTNTALYIKGAEFYFGHPTPLWKVLSVFLLLALSVYPGLLHATQFNKPEKINQLPDFI